MMKSYLKKQRLLKLANISIVALSLITPAAYAEEPCQDETKVYQTDVAKPSENMLAAYPDKTFKAFGDTTYDKFFGHTFTNLNIPGKTIVGATLEIKAKPTKSSLSNNDNLNLKFFGAGGSNLASGWGSYFGSGNPNPGLLSNQWIIIFYQNGHTFNLDLGNLPNSGGSILNQLNTHGFLDFLVQDDTTIESLKLTVKYKCSSNPPSPPCQGETKVDEPTAAIPSNNMQATYPDKTFKAFGDAGINKFFGHTFTGLNIPGKTIVGATLEVKAKPGNSSLSNNDDIFLRFFGVGGSVWASRFGLYNATPGLAPVANQVWVNPLTSQTFNLDLNNLPKGGLSIINELNNNAFLDVLVEDDTTIESLKLTVKYECTCTPPPPQMVAWWPLDETSGTNANDIINDNDGTHQNGPTSVSGMVGGALSFDGVNDYVKVPDNNVLDFGANQDFSIDAWILAAKESNRVRTIVDKRYEDGKTNTKGYTFFLNNGKLSFQLATGNGSWFCANNPSSSCTNYTSSSANLADGKWHHVAVTVNRSSSAPIGTFYVDGLPIDTTSIPSFRLGDLSNDQPLTIGRSTNTIVGSNFQGNIDEVEIFNRVLTDEEVYALWFAKEYGKCRPDIWIADPSPDFGAEPNQQSANIWMSPDIWVRNQADGLVNHQHQDVVIGANNHVYVRVRNIGDAPATNPTEIKVYRTLPSTGAGFDTDWTQVGTATINSTLAPNQIEIVKIPWNTNIPAAGHYCFYARVTNISDPLHIPEGTNAIANTFNNNNIAWRNFNVIALSPTDPVITDVIVRPILNIKPLKMVFEVTAEKEADLKKLADELVNVTIGGLENLSIKDPKGLEIIDGKEAKFTGDKGSFIIDVAKGEEVKLNLTFAPTSLIQKDLSGKVYFHVKQFEGEELIGGVSYELHPPKDAALSVTLDTFTANAANGKITINWTTGTETDNAGFTLWRATPINGQCSLDPSNYKDVRQVQPLVYSKSQDGVLGASYSEDDQNVESGVTYCYGLEDVDYDGKRTFHINNIISATLN